MSGFAGDNHAHPGLLDALSIDDELSPLDYLLRPPSSPSDPEADGAEQSQLITGGSHASHAHLQTVLEAMHETLPTDVYDKIHLVIDQVTLRPTRRLPAHFVQSSCRLRAARRPRECVACKFIPTAPKHPSARLPAGAGQARHDDARSIHALARRGGG